MTWRKPEERKLYVLALRAPNGQLNVMYGTLGPTTAHAWEFAVKHELLGTGHTQKTLERLGWKAREIRAEVWLP